MKLDSKSLDYAKEWLKMHFWELQHKEFAKLKHMYSILNGKILDMQYNFDFWKAIYIKQNDINHLFSQSITD